jgi:hypothetical protein
VVADTQSHPPVEGGELGVDEAAAHALKSFSSEVMITGVSMTAPEGADTPAAGCEMAMSRELPL